MNIQKNYNLVNNNTMALSVNTKMFTEIDSIKTLKKLIIEYDFTENSYYILGEGANTLFKGDYEGLVVKNSLSGKDIVNENDESVTVNVGSGENWDQFVGWSAERELSGIENLAFIPGSVGAAPVQNVAAYGEQISDSFVGLETIDLHTGNNKRFVKNDCDFKYRYSIFKEPEMKRYFITSVTFKLSKYAKFDTNYHSRFENESLLNWLEKEAEEPYKPRDVANAVTALRKYKLPTIEEYGTFGSAFLNPFVTLEKYEKLLKLIPDLQCYPVTDMDYSTKDWKDVSEMEYVKIPAGHLLDELGWKNKWIGNVGTFERHALLVITNKKASPKEVVNYLEEMKKSVKDAYDIELISEVVVV